MASHVDILRRATRRMLMTLAVLAAFVVLAAAALVTLAIHFGSADALCSVVHLVARDMPWVFVVALLLPSLALASWGIWSGVIRNERGVRTCPRCAYDLRATPASRICPECGYAARREQDLFPPRRRSWATVLGVLLSIAAATFPFWRRPAEVQILINMPAWLLVRLAPEDLSQPSWLGDELCDRAYVGELPVSAAREFARRCAGVVGRRMLMTAARPVLFNPPAVQAAMSELYDLNKSMGSTLATSVIATGNETEALGVFGSDLPMSRHIPPGDIAPTDFLFYERRTHDASPVTRVAAAVVLAHEAPITYASRLAELIRNDPAQDMCERIADRLFFSQRSETERNEVARLLVPALSEAFASREYGDHYLTASFLLAYSRDQTGVFLRLAAAEEASPGCFLPIEQLWWGVDYFKEPPAVHLAAANFDKGLENPDPRVRLYILKIFARLYELYSDKEFLYLCSSFQQDPDPAIRDFIALATARRQQEAANALATPLLPIPVPH